MSAAKNKLRPKSNDQVPEVAASFMVKSSAVNITPKITESKMAKSPICITSVKIEQTQLALMVSSIDIEFAKVKLLSSSLPSSKLPYIEYIQIPKIDFMDYSRIIIKDLYKFFETKFCLIVQADGFVVNSDFWNNDFLNYDYIGAPWPEKVQVNPGKWSLSFNQNRVGNGGFSIRSNKLAKVTSKIDFQNLTFPVKSEDVVICHYLYKDMIKQGIKFAPPELAAQFSIEDPNNIYNQNIGSVFGFHGNHFRAKVIKNILPGLNPKLQNIAKKETKLKKWWSKS